MVRNSQRSGDQFDTENEGKCCDAIVRLLERRTGVKRDPATISLNAKAGNTDKDVEIRLKLGQQEYAIEHTRIMGFGNVKTEQHKYFLEFRSRIKVVNFMIPGTYILYLSSLPKNILKDESQLTTLTTWAQQAAAELYALSQSEVSKGQRVEKTGTPWDAQFKVKLVRESWSLESYGMMDVRLCLSQSQNDSLRQQIDKALEAKCPKLKSHRDTGARSILILEMLGSSISHDKIIELLPDAITKRNDPPDDIFIVDSLTSKWFVIQVKEGDGDIGWPGGGAPQFLPGELNDITCR
jgi:hypothetical protein